MIEDRRSWHRTTLHDDAAGMRNAYCNTAPPLPSNAMPSGFEIFDTHVTTNTISTSAIATGCSQNRGDTFSSFESKSKTSVCRL